MSSPKGFGKNYFTLAAIQAYSASVTLTRSMTPVVSHHRFVPDEADRLDTITDDPLLLPDIDEPTRSRGSYYRYATLHTPRQHPLLIPLFLHVNSTLPVKDYV